MQYQVNVRRILREDATVFIEADNPKEAAEKALLEGQANSGNYDWSCYGAVYEVDADDVEEAE